MEAIPVFTTVIEEGSFSKAANKLGITKSAVSKRISGLEARLGVKLLQRSTRKLSLTEAGERYYEHAVQAFRFAKDAENAATELQKIPQGILRISAPMSLGRLHIASIIPLFLKRYPKIHIHMDMSDIARDVIAEGFDIALRGGRLPDSTLVARKLAPLHSVLCASPDYIALQGRPKTPMELMRHNCILYTYHATINEWVLIKNGEENRIRISGNYQVNNSEALYESLRQGLGIGRLPTFVAGAAIESGDLIPILPDYSMPHQELSAVFPEKQYMPEKVRVFLDFMIKELGGDKPHWDRWMDNRNHSATL